MTARFLPTSSLLSLLLFMLFVFFVVERKEEDVV
jgi:hypothetical protein